MDLRSTSIRASLLGVLCCLGVLPARVLAHEFWLEPSTHDPSAGDVLSVEIYVGHALLPERLPRDPNLLESFLLHHGGRRTPLVGRAGGVPAGMVRLTDPGMAWVSYVSRPTLLTMEAERFEAYLLEEGLEFISRRRAERGVGSEPVDEAFSRCAKALISVGGEPNVGFDAPLGLALELIPRVDPARLVYRDATEEELSVPLTPKPGEFFGRRADFELRLLFEGRPLEAARVSLSSLDKKWITPIVGRTDASGSLRVSLPCGGRWLASSVHMTEAPPELAEEAQWRSLWASMVFGAVEDPSADPAEPGEEARTPGPPR